MINKDSPLNHHLYYINKMYRSQGGGTHLNGASHRRPQTLMSPIGVERNKIDEIELTITIQKDASGYGMKVLYSSRYFVHYFILIWFSFVLVFQRVFRFISLKQQQCNYLYHRLRFEVIFYGLKS